MKINKQIICVLLGFIILLTGLASSGVGGEQAKYVDGTTGYLVNLSTPEDTVKSFYMLLDGQSFAAASKLYTTEGQKSVDASVLQQQVKSAGISGTSLPMVFPTYTANSYAAVVFVRSLKVSGNTNNQMVVGVEFTKRDGLNSRWSLVGQLREIPEKYRLRLFEQMTGLEEVANSQASGLKQFSEDEAASITRQLQALVTSCKNALEESKNPNGNGIGKLELPNFEKEFITKYAPYTNNVWSVPGQSQQNLPAGHPDIE